MVEGIGKVWNKDWWMQKLLKQIFVREIFCILRKLKNAIFIKLIDGRGFCQLEKINNKKLWFEKSLIIPVVAQAKMKNEMAETIEKLKVRKENVGQDSRKQGG